MIRLLATAVVALIADAIALVVVSWILPDMSLEASGFLIAVLVFAGVAVLIEPLMRQIAIKNAPALLGSSALLATIVSLVVAAVVSDGLHISGSVTWVMATVLVWAVALIARMLLPLVIFKKVLANRATRTSAKAG